VNIRPELPKFTMKNSMSFDRRASSMMAIVTAFMFATVLLKSSFGQPANPNLASGPSAATNAPATQLSLAQAKEIAFERNWDLLAAKSGIDSATAQLIVSKEFPNPIASLSTAYIGNYNNGTVMGNGVWERNYDTIFAVNQLIEIAGKRHDRQVAARAGIFGAKARFYDAKRTLDQGATKAYIAALLAEDNVQILNESSRLLRHEADIAEARFKAGDISDSDKKQIEINAEQFALQAKSAEAAAVQARIAVEVLMGLAKPKGNWVSAGSLDQLVQAPLPSVPPPSPEASRPDVLAAEADVKSAKANLQLQKAIRIPDPTIQIEYQHQPPSTGPPADTVGVGVSFPLPLWNLNGGNIKAAQASVDQFALAAGKVKAQMEADISNAESAFGEAHARWLSYRDQTAPKSTKVRESVAFAYEKGGASLVDLLDAERTDNDIRLATVQAMSDTAAAMSDLVAARTVLSQTELEKHNP
jgi:outer membrane protein, heavy metal efflux system